MVEPADSDYPYLGVTISQGRKELKGSIIVECVSVGQITPGKTKVGKPYQKQIVVVKDHSGTQEITLWNDEIGRLVEGNFYKIDTPNWTVYNEMVQLGLGRLGQISPAIKDDLIPDRYQNAGGPQGYMPKKTEQLPVDEDIEIKSSKETVTLLQIEKGVKKTLEQYGENSGNVQRVGMFVKTIYGEIKKKD